MPTPVGHSLVGCALYLSLIRNKLEKSWKTILLVVFISNLPDVDYLPGFIIGYPNRYHHGMTHSLGFTIIVGTIFAILYLQRQRNSNDKRMSFLELFPIFSGLYLSHIILDYLAVDTSFPYGEPLFWPVTNRYFISPFPLFLDVHKASSSDMFLRSLVSWHNLWTVITEAVIFGSIIGVIKLIRDLRG